MLVEPVPALAPATSPRLRYAVAQSNNAHYQPFLEDWIRRERPRRVADLGGGAFPLLSPDFVRRQCLDYTLVDISAAEMAKGRHAYRMIEMDLAAPNFTWAHEPMDLVFSRSVAEHVPSGRRFHRNIFSMLAPGGIAIHSFPTLFALPFVVNRMLPEPISDRLLSLIHRRDRHLHGKFPAHYSWCLGPGARQMQRFAGLGYEVVEYCGLFGHPYFEAIPVLDRLEQRLARLLVRHPVNLVTTYAMIVLRRPAQAASRQAASAGARSVMRS